MANECYDFMCANPHLFSKIHDPLKAASMAHNGYLVFAAIKDAPHGHIAPISPSGTLETSGSWKIQIPHCYNVGKQNKLMGINYAFSELPDFFIAI